MVVFRPARHVAQVETPCRAVCPSQPSDDPADADGPEADLYPEVALVPNIMQALSLVPDEARALQRSSDAHYVEMQDLADPSARRDLDRLQIELVAARVSALNECFY